MILMISRTFDVNNSVILFALPSFEVDFDNPPPEDLKILLRFMLMKSSRLDESEFLEDIKC